MNRPLYKAAVIGAGVMGAGIAAHIASAGIEVVLLDIVPNALNDEEKKKGITEKDKAFRNRFSVSGKDRACDKKFGTIYSKEMASLITTGNLEDDLELLRDCDWVIEVVLERLDVKKDLFAKIAPYCKDTAIISTNTSGVSVNQISADMPQEFKERFLGTHFFNPPRYMKLFEVIPTTETKPEIMEFIDYVGKTVLGKGVVVAKDTPSFIGNRIGSYASSVTINLMDEYGLSIEEVDVITGPIMGRPKTATYKTIDMVGADILKHTVDNIIDNITDEQEKKELKLPEFYDEMVKNGQLGNKTKQGFYKKVVTDKGRAVLVWDHKAKEYVPTKRPEVAIVTAAKAEKGFDNKFKALLSGDDNASKYAWEIIKKTLLYSANRVPEIADDYRRIDDAMRFGYNWQKGPFQLWDSIGVKESIERMEKEGDTVPKWVKDRVASGQTTFYVAEASSAKVIKEIKDVALIDLGDGVVNLEIRAVNITEPAIDFMQEAITMVENDWNYKGIVISNRNDNFCMGVDMGVVYKCIVEKDFVKLEDVLTRLAKLDMSIKYLRKPVVAAVKGMAIGGGLSLMMHTHKTVAAAESYLGYVDAGVGVTPSGGGLKEYVVQSMNRVKDFNFSSFAPVAQKIWENVAMGKVAKSAFEAKSMGFIRDTDRIIMDADAIVSVAKLDVIRMSDDFFTPQIKTPVKVTGIAGAGLLNYIAEVMMQGNFISPYDKVVAGEAATIITGGDSPKGGYVTEEQLIVLEVQSIIKLCKEARTLERIEYMAKTGKPLRN